MFTEDIHFLLNILGPDAKPLPKGDVRTYRVWLDTNQYKIDLERTAKGMEVIIF